MNNSTEINKNNINYNAEKSLVVLKSVNVLNHSSIELPSTVDTAKIRSLKLKDVVLIDSIFWAILTRLQHLETLEFTNVYLIISHCPEHTPAFMKLKILCSYVKTIIFEHSDFEIFNSIVVPSLQNLKIVSLYKPYYPIADFLNQYGSLKKLEFHAVSCDLMEFFEVTSYNFNLKHLLLTSSLFDQEPSLAFEQNFFAFLKVHANTLSTVEIRTMVPINTLDFMLKRFRLLKSLTLKVCYLPNDILFYIAKKPKKSVKKLSLEGPYFHADILIALLNLYPAVHELNLHDYNLEFDMTKIMVYIASKCKDLKELSIVRMPTIVGDLKFIKLQTFRVGYINNIDEISAVLRCNPTITTLIIDFVFRKQCDEKFIQTLLNSEIKHLQISAEASEIKRIHDFIMADTRNLLTLSLKIQLEDELKCYNFKFPKEDELNVKNLSSKLLDDIKCIMIDELADYLDEL